MSTFKDGVKFGKFQILRFLGQADIAELYVAEQINMQRKVVLRLVPPAIAAARPDRLALFMEAGRAVAQLKHPAIVGIHEVGKVTDQKGAAYNFVVEEHISGQSLTDRLVERPMLPVQEAVQIIGAVGSALSHAHRSHVLHGSLQPDAIYFDNHNQIKLTGLGYVVHDDDACAHVLPEGNPAYQSPEIIQHQPWSAAADVYALACLSFHLLAGRPPFIGQPEQLRRAQCESKPPQLTDLVEPDQALLGTIIEQGLEKNTSDRQPSVAVFLQCIHQQMEQPHAKAPVQARQALRPPAKRAAVGRSAAPAGAGPRQRRPQKTGRKAKSSSHLGTIAVALVAIVVVAGAVVVYGMPGSSSAEAKPAQVQAGIEQAEALLLALPHDPQEALAQLQEALAEQAAVMDTAGLEILRNRQRELSAIVQSQQLAAQEDLKLARQEIEQLLAQARWLEAQDVMKARAVPHRAAFPHLAEPIIRHVQDAYAASLQECQVAIQQAEDEATLAALLASFDDFSAHDAEQLTSAVTKRRQDLESAIDALQVQPAIQQQEHKQQGEGPAADVTTASPGPDSVELDYAGLKTCLGDPRGVAPDWVKWQAIVAAAQQGGCKDPHLETLQQIPAVVAELHDDLQIYLAEQPFEWQQGEMTHLAESWDAVGKAQVRVYMGRKDHGGVVASPISQLPMGDIFRQVYFFKQGQLALGHQGATALFAVMWNLPKVSWDDLPKKYADALQTVVGLNMAMVPKVGPQVTTFGQAARSQADTTVAASTQSNLPADGGQIPALKGQPRRAILVTSPKYKADIANEFAVTGRAIEPYVGRSGKITLVPDIGLARAAQVQVLQPKKNAWFTFKNISVHRQQKLALNLTAKCFQTFVVGVTDNQRFVGLHVRRNGAGIEAIHHVVTGGQGALVLGPEVVPQKPATSLNFGLEITLDDQLRPTVAGKFQGSLRQRYDWSFDGPVRIHFENLGPVEIPAKPEAAMQVGRLMVIDANEHVDQAYKSARSQLKK